MTWCAQLQNPNITVYEMYQKAALREEKEETRLEAWLDE